MSLPFDTSSAAPKKPAIVMVAADRIGIAGKRRCTAKAERHHVGHVERAAPKPVAVAFSSRAGGSDVAERVGALVAEIGRVGGAADAEGVQNEDECARHPQAWVNVAGVVAET